MSLRTWARTLHLAGDSRSWKEGRLLGCFAALRVYVERSKRFDDAVLPILGIHLMAEDEGGLGYGSGTFHFSVQVPIDESPQPSATGLTSLSL